MAENKIITDHRDAAPYMAPGAAMVPPGCRPASREALSRFVPGRPAPQGSKRPLGRRGGFGKHVMIESSKAVKPWRADIREAFADCEPHLFVTTAGPVALIVMIVFVMPRPVATPKRKPTPPHVKRPDLDKLVRAVFDALKSAGVYADDSQVITVHAHKRVAELGETTGAMIHVQPAVSIFDTPSPADVV